MEIEVVDTLVEDVDADVLVLAMREGKPIDEVADDAVRRVAGDQFHAQYQMARESLHGGVAGDVMTACIVPHRGRFTRVLFVENDGHESLHEVVIRALFVAEDAQCSHVVLTDLGLESSRDDGRRLVAAAQDFACALRDLVGIVQFVENVTVVLYDDARAASELQHALIEIGVQLPYLR